MQFLNKTLNRFMKNPYYNDLRQYRLSKKLSQSSMADLLNISQSTYNRLEKPNCSIVFKYLEDLHAISGLIEPEKYLAKAEETQIESLSYNFEIDKLKTEIGNILKRLELSEKLISLYENQQKLLQVLVNEHIKTT